MCTQSTPCEPISPLASTQSAPCAHPCLLKRCVLGARRCNDQHCYRRSSRDADAAAAAAMRVDAARPRVERSPPRRAHAGPPHAVDRSVYIQRATGAIERGAGGACARACACVAGGHAVGAPGVLKDRRRSAPEADLRQRMRRAACRAFTPTTCARTTTARVDRSVRSGQRAPSREGAGGAACVRVRAWARVCVFV
jgi:hypothetical protein